MWTYISVSRLSPHTAEAELVNCINEVKGSVKVHEVMCEKLQPHYEQNRSTSDTRPLSVRVDSQHMSTAIILACQLTPGPSGCLYVGTLNQKMEENKELRIASFNCSLSQSKLSSLS